MIFAKPWLDAIIVLLIVLLFFGPKRLPGLGKGLGEGMREFKDSITGGSGSDEDGDKAGLNQGTPPPPASAAPPTTDQSSASPGPTEQSAVAPPASESAPVGSSGPRS